jgi:hypothetical protein
MKCRCGGEMEQGFVPDHGDVAATWVSVWVRGAPEVKQGWWKKVNSGFGVVWEEQDAWALDAWRCGTCGLVDLVALRRPTPGTTSKDPQ